MREERKDGLQSLLCIVLGSPKSESSFLGDLPPKNVTQFWATRTKIVNVLSNLKITTCWSFVKGSWHFRHPHSLQKQSIHTSLSSNSIFVSSKHFSNLSIAAFPYLCRLWWLHMNLKAVEIYMGLLRPAVLLRIGGAPDRSCYVYFFVRLKGSRP